MNRFNGVSAIADEITKQEQINQVINNIYSKLSTSNCEYVDNFNKVVNNMENISNTFNSADYTNISNKSQLFHQYYNIVSNNINFADKIKGYRGYVENFVDNIVNREDNLKVIHKELTFLEKFNSSGLTDSNVNNDYSTFTDSINNIKNTENNNLNNSYGNININMGGITQNITESNSNDILDMLVDKLRKTISGCGERGYG